MSVVIQSIQTEISHLLSASRVLIESDKTIKYILLIPIIFHILRYSKYLKQSIKIGIKQGWLLHIINWYIILNHEKTEYSTELAFMSGLITLYHVYELYHGKKVEKNYLVDIFMIGLAISLIKYINDPYANFIGIRELVYHLLEWVVIYK